jgi:hypothetical protein
MLTNKVYIESTGRSILVSPLFSTDGPIQNRLGPGGEVLYSSHDGFVNTGYADAFQSIEQYFNVDIVYGRKIFEDRRTGIRSTPEVLLIDVRQINNQPINEFKGQLFEHFGISGMRYERMWEFEEWVRLAPPAIAALKAIGAATHDSPTVIISHEFMGMPTALAAMLETEFNFKTVFYALEVATVRRIVEDSHHQADRLLAEHRDKLKALAEALLNAESLNEKEIRAVTGLAEPPGQADSKAR